MCPDLRTSQGEKELINFLSRKEAPPPHPAGRGQTAKLEGEPRSWEQVLKASAWHTEVATPLEKSAGCPQGDVQVQTRWPTPWFCEWEPLRALPWKPKVREGRCGLVEELSYCRIKGFSELS